MSTSVTFWRMCGDDSVMTMTEPPMASISMSPPFCSWRIPRGRTTLTTSVKAKPAVSASRNRIGRTSATKATNQTTAAVHTTVAGKYAHFMTAMCRSMSWIVYRASTERAPAAAAAAAIAKAMPARSGGRRLKPTRPCVRAARMAIPAATPMSTSGRFTRPSARSGHAHLGRRRPRRPAGGGLRAHAVEVRAPALRGRVRVRRRVAGGGERLTPSLKPSSAARSTTYPVTGGGNSGAVHASSTAAPAAAAVRPDGAVVVPCRTSGRTVWLSSPPMRWMPQYASKLRSAGALTTSRAQRRRGDGVQLRERRPRRRARASRRGRARSPAA